MCLLLDCVNVNHIHDNPEYFTCDCVDPNDQCLEDEQCVPEKLCPEFDGKPMASSNKINY